MQIYEKPREVTNENDGVFGLMPQYAVNMYIYYLFISAE